MNSPSNNQPRPPTVAHSALPPLPAPAGDITLNWGTPQQRLASGFSTEQMDAHARAAWNMGLNAGLLHAPTITDTGLPELRDHLATAKVMGSSVTLSPSAAGALHAAMTTPTGLDPLKEDPVDIIRTLLCTVDHYWSLPAEKREAYPTPTSEFSPLMQAARRACVERGYTAGGLAIDHAAGSVK